MTIIMSSLSQRLLLDTSYNMKLTAHFPQQIVFNLCCHSALILLYYPRFPKYSLSQMSVEVIVGNSSLDSVVPLTIKGMPKQTKKKMSVLMKVSTCPR